MKNNKVLVYWITLGILIIGYTIGMGIWIGKVNTKVEYLSTKFEEITNHISHIQRDISTIQGDIKEIKTDIKWLKKK